jgi:hypothetical protein
MNITPQEAQESLVTIDDIIGQTRRTIASGCSSTLLILWGAIWVVGYTGTQFFPAKALWFWGPLNFLGAAASWYFGSRAKPIKGVMDIRIGLFWATLFAFSAVWIVLLAPSNPQRIGAYYGTIPMFAYVVGGLWFGRFFTWLGLTVTGLILAGVFLLPQWLNLWIGITGGGSLMVSGFYIRKYWR